MQTIHLKIAQQSYPIYIGKQILQQPHLITDHIHGNQILIVTNQTVAPLYLDQLVAGLEGYACNTLILPDGERYKTLDTLKQIFDALIKNQHHRTTTLLALGGGVIGDMTGFAAASYCRGVNYIQIPTTLVGQVDAAIGGKTAVNYQSGKNLIGAFHHPQCVLIDITTLRTLPEREYKSGLAEVIKYGLIADANFFFWLENNSEHILKREHNALMHMIQHSCQIKANIVAMDEKEHGIRSLLNLGHTFGHAIESATHYQQWLHGEAVALGIRLAAIMSMQQNWLSETEAHRIQALFDKIGLPDRIPRHVSSQKILELMQLDKKIMNQQLRLVLLKKIGTALTTAEFNQADLQKTLEIGRFSN